MPLITTIVTGAAAVKDFQALMFGIQMFQPDAEVFVATDTATAPLLPSGVNIHSIMDKYTGLTRKDMEAMDGHLYPTRFHDYTIEKATILQAVFDKYPEKAREEGVWFLDADICLFGPLPPVPPTYSLALSPHMIRPGDESRYGKYNAGFLWIREPFHLAVWRRATFGSRFYEQAALERVAEGTDVYEFPIQNNFGWWRHIQSVDPPPVIESRLGYNRIPNCVGLKYDGEMLRSVHTHWVEKLAFNTWIRAKLEFVGRSHTPAKAWADYLRRNF
jgi:hypothetical protein